MSKIWAKWLQIWAYTLTKLGLRAPKPKKNWPIKIDQNIPQNTPLQEPYSEALLPAPVHLIREFSQIQLSPHTQRAYRKDLEDFFFFLRKQEYLNNWQVKVRGPQIAEFRNYLVLEKKLAKGSVTRKLAVVKSFYKWAQSQDLIQKNPAELIKGFPQSQDSKTGYLNEEEIEQLLEYFATGRFPKLFKHLSKVTIETLLMLGLRRAEAAAIKISDLEYSHGEWLLNVRGKGGRDRRLPLPPRLLISWSFWFQRISEEAPQLQLMHENPKAWISWKERYPELPLLISTRANFFGKGISPGEVGHIVRKAARKAGLAQRVSAHMLRSTAITHALDQGASHRGVQQMAGWTTPLMISRYDKRRKDPKYSAVRNLKYAQEQSPE